MAARALEGIRVLEYCHGLSGPYCTKLLADLGAEVMHVEPPGNGDDTRRLPPFAHDVPHHETSGIFLFLNANKLGLTLDPRLPAGQEIFRRLTSAADVLVEDGSPGDMEALELGGEELHRLNPQLIVLSITPFGRTGPYSGYKASGLNIAHVSGQGYTLPLPSPHLERAPVKVGGHCTEYDSGQTAAVALLAALYARAMTGRGQLIEVSEQEAILSLQRVENVAFANGGEVITRRGPESDRGVSRMFECSDGYVVSVTPVEHQKAALAKLADMAAPARNDDGRTGGLEGSAAVHARLANWMREHTRAEVCAQAQALSCPIAPINSAADVAQSPQINARDFFAEVTHPVAGPLRLPARTCHFSRTPFEVQHAAPLLGEHNQLVYGQRLGYTAHELQALRDSGVI